VEMIFGALGGNKREFIIDAKIGVWFFFQKLNFEGIWQYFQAGHTVQKSNKSFKRKKGSRFIFLFN
jgi:hypothetical protein